MKPIARRNQRDSRDTEPSDGIAFLDLRQCRSWRQQRLQFHPGLNVIVGPSDSGKSNIVRAIKSVIENVSSASMLRRGQQDGEVSILFRDRSGVRLRKSRSNKVNEYTIVHRGKRATYRAVGLSVPEPVSACVRMGPAQVGDELVLLNVQSQVEPPILVADSAAKVAKLIGSISGLDAVQRALSRAASDQRSAVSESRSATKIFHSEVRAYRKMRLASRLPFAKRCLDKADSLLALVDETEAAKSRLSGAVESLRRLSQYYASVCQTAVSQDVMQQLSEVRRRIATLHDRLLSLTKAQEAARRARDSLALLNQEWSQRRAEYDAATQKYESLRRRLNVCAACGQSLPPQSQFRSLSGRGVSNHE